MIVPKKSLGQHFLRDENVARKIIDSLNLKSSDVVVEIGPGTGALTKYLCEKTRHVIGIEVDRRAAQLLEEMFPRSVQILQADVREVQLASVAHSNRLRVVGNIPYFITSDILFWLFDQRETVQDATVTMQLEVARRLVAKPRTKEYGILSVFTQFHTKLEILFRVSRNCFYPKPNVDSAVVQLDFNVELPPCDQRLFAAVVRTTFGKRRKTLRNGLKSLHLDRFNISKLDFNLDLRPEQLSVQDFVELSNQISQQMSSMVHGIPEKRTKHAR